MSGIKARQSVDEPTQFGVDDFMELEVNSNDVKHTDGYIHADYVYQKNIVKVSGQSIRVSPQSHKYQFRTKKSVAKTGVMLVGWGGNNGSTMTAGILANKNNITWQTKEGMQSPNYFGSLTQASTIRIGSTRSNNPNKP